MKLKYTLGKHEKKGEGGLLPAQNIDCYLEGLMVHFGKIVVYGTKCKSIASKVVKTLNNP